MLRQRLTRCLARARAGLSPGRVLPPPLPALPARLTTYGVRPAALLALVFLHAVVQLALHAASLSAARDAARAAELPLATGSDACTAGALTADDFFSAVSREDVVLLLAHLHVFFLAALAVWQRCAVHLSTHALLAIALALLATVREAHVRAAQRAYQQQIADALCQGNDAYTFAWHQIGVLSALSLAFSLLALLPALYLYTVLARAYHARTCLSAPTALARPLLTVHAASCALHAGCALGGALGALLLDALARSSAPPSAHALAGAALVLAPLAAVAGWRALRLASRRAGTPLALALLAAELALLCALPGAPAYARAAHAWPGLPLLNALAVLMLLATVAIVGTGWWRWRRSAVRARLDAYYRTRTLFTFALPHSSARPRGAPPATAPCASADGDGDGGCDAKRDGTQLSRSTRFSSFVLFPALDFLPDTPAPQLPALLVPGVALHFAQREAPLPPLPSTPPIPAPAPPAPAPAPVPPPVVMRAGPRRPPPLTLGGALPLAGTLPLPILAPPARALLSPLPPGLLVRGSVLLTPLSAPPPRAAPHASAAASAAGGADATPPGRLRSNSIPLTPTFRPSPVSVSGARPGSYGSRQSSSGSSGALGALPRGAAPPVLFPAPLPSPSLSPFAAWIALPPSAPSSRRASGSVASRLWRGSGSTAPSSPRRGGAGWTSLLARSPPLSPRARPSVSVSSPPLSPLSRPSFAFSRRDSAAASSARASGESLAAWDGPDGARDDSPGVSGARVSVATLGRFRRAVLARVSSGLAHPRASEHGEAA